MGVLALLLAGIGVALVGTAGLLLRSLGSAWRVARVLGSTRDVPLAAVAQQAGRYVRTHGRIASEDEFPDEAQRPLVFRRTRIQASRARGDWTTLNDDRLAVPFSIEERGVALEIDVDALGDGLVVVPRIAEGVASELPDALSAELREPLAPEIPVRVRIDQVSAVEHATVAGLVEVGGDGGARLTAGAGRPLILTTVAPDAAMRLLASEHRRRVVAAAVLVAAGLGSLAMALVAALFGVRP